MRPDDGDAFNAGWNAALTEALRRIKMILMKKVADDGVRVPIGKEVVLQTIRERAMPRALPSNHWWTHGDYVGGDCPACGRARLMSVTDPSGNDHVICEKCYWEPAKNDFCHEALED